MGKYKHIFRLLNIHTAINTITTDMIYNRCGKNAQQETATRLFSKIHDSQTKKKSTF
jgi:hypothetical protein